MPKISIRFEKIEPRCEVFIEEFYESLGKTVDQIPSIDTSIFKQLSGFPFWRRVASQYSSCLNPKKYTEFQYFYLNLNTQVKIFGMHVSVPENIKNLAEWVCSFEEKSGAILLSVSGFNWAAWANSKSLEHIPKNITSLRVGLNKNDKNIPNLNRFCNLIDLDLGCQMNKDIPAISELKLLKYLDLSYSELVKLPESFSNLSNLKELRLNSCKSLLKIDEIAVLKNLEILDLSDCDSLSDLSPLSDLDKLVSLRLSSGSLWREKQMSDVDGSSNLANKPCDLAPLSNLTNLLNLDLSYCLAKDFSCLSKLKKLVNLNLYCCYNISDISYFSNLLHLSNLCLVACREIRTLSPLDDLKELRSLSIESERIKTIEPLRNIRELRHFDGFNPPEVAELLAHASFLRKDRSLILKRQNAWLSEAACWHDGPLSMQDRFAATLGEAFSLLGESPIEHDYENFINSRSDFSSAPWKAWYGGTLKESGFDLYRQRVERVSIATMLPGAIGGACATLPYDQNADWSREWLAGLEKARLSDAKALLSVAPEICLAHARLCETEALGRWLVQFTDPSDPAALDPIHAALAGFQLGKQNLLAAENHIFAIESPKLRDPALAELVSALAKSDPERASAKLLLIDSPALRSELAKRLAAKPGASETTLQRLAVAMGDSPSNLADLIISIPDPANKTFIETLSSKLQPHRNATLRKIAEEFLREAEKCIL